MIQGFEWKRDFPLPPLIPTHLTGNGGVDCRVCAEVVVAELVDYNFIILYKIMKEKKVWTGRYWMNQKQARQISKNLKKYYKNHEVWNKGLRWGKFVNATEANIFRRSSESYYIKELELNAKRSKKQDYYGKNPERKEEIARLKKKYDRITGKGRPRQDWSIIELEYLYKNYKTKPVLEMCNHLKRSWNSVNHKLSRLSLIYYNKWNLKNPKP